MFAIQHANSSLADAVADKDSTLHHRIDPATPRAHHSGGAASYGDKKGMLLADAGILSAAAGRATMERSRDRLTKEDYEAASRIPRSGSRKRAVQEEDVGLFISSSKQSSMCTARYIDCDYGKVRGTDQSCKDACDGKCCVGEESYGGYYAACEKFTGKVCKDDSCSGRNSCFNATISSVVNSCKDNKSCYKATIPSGVVNSCDGDFACYKVGSYFGKIGKIVDSCIGSSACRSMACYLGSAADITGSCRYERACYGLGFGSGRVGNVLNSCIGSYACEDIAYNYGSAGNLSNACTAPNACYKGAEYGGTIASITSSCTAELSCSKLGYGAGKVGNVKDSCTAGKACEGGAKFGGSIASITNSCTAFISCYKLGFVAGEVGNVKDSCNAYDSCEKISYNRGSIGDILASCNATGACLQAGSTLNGAITSNLNKCCNTEYACKQATQATLPAQCKDSKVRRCAMMQFASSKHRQNHAIDFISLSSLLSHQPLC